jgi:hypothetical protein
VGTSQLRPATDAGQHGTIFQGGTTCSDSLSDWRTLVLVQILPKTDSETGTLMWAIYLGSDTRKQE